MPFHSDGALLPLTALASWCGLPPRPIPFLMFLTGLVGGLSHCGPMCGPFVLAQAAGASAGRPELRRLAGGLLLPYHLGRVATYAALGALAASIGAMVVAVAPVRAALAGLLIGAALLFVGQASLRLAPNLTAKWPARLAQLLAGRWAMRLAALPRPLFNDASPAGRLALGAVLGLLPCGFLYSALAAAAATRSPGAGAAAMAAFGLGTMPSLVLIGIGSATAAARWRLLAERLLAPLFLFNAAVLTAMALVVAFSL
jgi:uncharacterized protein